MESSFSDTVMSNNNIICQFSCLINFNVSNAKFLYLCRVYVTAGLIYSVQSSNERGRPSRKALAISASETSLLIETLSGIARLDHGGICCARSNCGQKWKFDSTANACWYGTSSPFTKTHIFPGKTSFLLFKALQCGFFPGFLSLCNKYHISY